MVAQFVSRELVFKHYGLTRKNMNGTAIHNFAGITIGKKKIIVIFRFSSIMTYILKFLAGSSSCVFNFFVII